MLVAAMLSRDFTIRLNGEKKFKARVLKFHIYMASLSKNSLPIFFFLSQLSPLAELCPF